MAGSSTRSTSREPGGDCPRVATGAEFRCSRFRAEPWRYRPLSRHYRAVPAWAALVAKASALGPAGILAVVSEPRVLAALRVSFGTALAAAAIDAVLGLLIAWVLVRYRFPGRRLADALVDLPFALPTAVAGISLTALYADTGWLGAPLAGLGVEVAYTPLGILTALIFVGLPFPIRTLQPLLLELEAEVEEAALTLGAMGFQIWWQVILPPLIPGMLTGAALAFARAVGEYGSVIFIAGNMPGISEMCRC